MAEPVRTCVGCRTSDEQRHLVRLVADAAGRVRVDGRRRRLPGRGAYVHATLDCVTDLVQKGALGRSLRRKVEPLRDTDLWSRIEQAGISAQHIQAEETGKT